MPLYRAPGVYIEEIQSGARPITAVGTSTAGFIGVVDAPEAPSGRAVRINNWLQFVKVFLQTGKTGVGPTSSPLVNAVFGFYQNGGSTCYVVNMGHGSKDEKTERKDLSPYLALMESIDEIALVVAPGYTEKIHYDALLTHCEKMKDRFAILDSPPHLEGIDRFLAADSVGPRCSDGGYGAVYFPWIKTVDAVVADGAGGGPTLVEIPPSGHIAGLYARVDGGVGVHKAPANEIVRGAVGLSYSLTQDEIADLNDNCINAIKVFPGGAVRVWGARTVAGSSSQWKYINVRRLFSMIEESIAKSTTWVVFQPNDFTLWNSIVRDVSAFLTMMWRQGALQGGRPEEAFYVKCDRETNPQEEIDAGRVNIEIGIAPVKPAEFVVFRIGQTAAGTERS